MTRKKAKGIGLLSGGLDSMLAVKVLQEQDLEVIAVCFVTPFFGPKAGLEAARTLGIEVRIVDISGKHLEMLKAPVYGYGSQMNPCIDCHALMLKEAGHIMEEEGGDFLFTGEVLGQRPMSQRRDSLRSVEKLSGYPGLVLRPLSARLLPPTNVEVASLVDRERLLDIHGRSRKRQETLAKSHGVRAYPQPGGGCLLTKEGFARKLKALLQSTVVVAPRQAELIKWGRCFTLPGGSLCLAGRNRSDNDRLEGLVAAEDVLFSAVDYPGPIGVLMGSPSLEGDFPTAANLILSYSDAPVGRSCQVEWRHMGETGVIALNKSERKHFEGFQI